MYDLKEIDADFESVGDEEAPRLVKASEVDEDEEMKKERAMGWHAASSQSDTDNITPKKPAFIYF